MKRILAAVKGIIEKGKSERTVKRIERAIEIAKDNANDELDFIKDQKADLVANLTDTSDYEGFINKLSSLMDEEEAQKATLKRLDEISAYLNEEIEVEE